MNRRDRRLMEARLRPSTSGDVGLTRQAILETDDDAATIQRVEVEEPGALRTVTTAMVATIDRIATEVTEKEAQHYVELVVKRSFASDIPKSIVIDVVRERVKAAAEAETLGFQEQIREKVRWLLLTELEPRVKEIVERAVANAVASVRAELGVK